MPQPMLSRASLQHPLAPLAVVQQIDATTAIEPGAVSVRALTAH